MIKYDLFLYVLTAVSDEYGIKNLFGDHHCRSTEMTDARTCVVSLLYFDIGINMAQIAALTGLSVSGVCYLANRLDERRKQCFSFRTAFQRVRNKVCSYIAETSE